MALQKRLKMKWRRDGMEEGTEFLQEEQWRNGLRTGLRNDRLEKNGFLNDLRRLFLLPFIELRGR